MKGDAETSAFQAHTFIISNLAFQWFDNLPVALKKFSQSTEGARFFDLSTKDFFGMDAVL